MVYPLIPLYLVSAFGAAVPFVFGASMACVAAMILVVFMKKV
jgi:hypothetical protein